MFRYCLGNFFCVLYLTTSFPPLGLFCFFVIVLSYSTSLIILIPSHSLSPYLSLFLSLSVSLFVSLSFSHCLSVCLSLSLSVSLSLSSSLSLFLPPAPSSLSSRSWCGPMAFFCAGSSNVSKKKDEHGLSLKGLLT